MFGSYLKFLLCFVDGVLFSVDFDFEVFHALLVGLGDCALMVTQNGHSSVGTIVRQDLEKNPTKIITLGVTKMKQEQQLIRQNIRFDGF